MMSIYDDSLVAEYQTFTQRILDLVANFIIQIFYGGSMTTFNIGERFIWSPSDRKNENTEIFAKQIKKQNQIPCKRL
ncbi:MAG: hypothetical protein ACRCX5_00205 [Bacteroidales bacterium]